MQKTYMESDQLHKIVGAQVQLKAVKSRSSIYNILNLRNSDEFSLKQGSEQIYYS